MTWRDIGRFWRGPTYDDIEAAGEVPTDKVELANAAERLLGDPIFQLALGRIEKRLYDTWRLSEPGQAEIREAAFRMHWAIGEVRDELRRLIANARMT